jgi:hypothetical protein
LTRFGEGGQDHLVKVPACVSIAAIALGALACGSDESSTSVSDATPVGSIEKPPQPPGLTLLRAKRAVERYYQSVDQGNFATAWALLTRDPRIEFGGFGTWRDGYDTSTGTDLVTANVTRTSAEKASVRVRVNSTDVDACGDTVEQSFAGTWAVELVEGIARLTSSDIEKLSGGDPLAAADCAPAPAVDPVPTSGCHPSYEGACLDPAASDYDCASGSGDGPLYVEGPVYVVGPDEYGLDANYDGTGCET